MTQKIDIKRTGNGKTSFHILSLSMNEKLGEIWGNVMDASITMVLILLKLKVSLDESKMLNLLEIYLPKKKSFRRSHLILLYLTFLTCIIRGFFFCFGFF